jgi:hypothetical protein
MLEHKNKVLAKAKSMIHDSLDLLKRAAAATHANSTSAESKPEGKYDTRGLEASYLAGAQAEQVAIVEEGVQKLANLTIEDEPDTVLTGSLVVVSTDTEELSYLVLPAGGGLQIEQDGDTILVITPNSPIGCLIMGVELGTSVALPEHTGAYISEIY